jgi:hypothetical protein
VGTRLPSQSREQIPTSSFHLFLLSHSHNYSKTKFAMPGSRSNVYWRVRVQRSVRPQTSDDDEVHASKKKYLAAIQYGTSSPGDTANTQVSPTLEDSEHGSVDSVEIAHDNTCMQAVCDVFDTVSQRSERSIRASLTFQSPSCWRSYYFQTSR